MYFFLRKKVPKSSCNGFELAFGKFPRNKNSIPKNIKLGQALRQLCFLYIITFFFLGSADVATADTSFFAYFFAEKKYERTHIKKLTEEKAYIQRVLRM